MKRGRKPKEQYVRAIKEALLQKDGRVQKIDLDTITVDSVWRHPSGGWRLSTYGFTILADILKLDVWSHTLSHLEVSNGGYSQHKFLLALQKAINTPFFYEFHARGGHIDIHVFDEVTGTAMGLMGPLKFINAKTKNKYKSKDN